MRSANHLVTTCTDAFVTPQCSTPDDGTLRKAYFCAKDGDSIDLTNLRPCTITLTAPLTDSAQDLTLLGPGRGVVAIRGQNKNRVLVHNGSGTLSINNLRLEFGYLKNTYNYSGGGCIYSFGSVEVNSSDISACRLVSSGGPAKGGAIFAKNNVLISGSTVIGGVALSNAFPSLGGGVFANSVSIVNSTVSGNAAGATSGSKGGGVFANRVDVAYSTISHNNSITGAGISGDTVLLKNSTISKNYGSASGAALEATSANIYSSTIVNNACSLANGIAAAGVDVVQSLALNSSIIANNTSNGQNNDVRGVVILGANNIVTSHLGGDLPTDTIESDPLVGALTDNGGPTLTNPLLPGSPAINRGNNVSLLADDQRLISERTVGTRPDIGAYESDTLFADGLESPPH